MNCFVKVSKFFVSFVFDNKLFKQNHSCESWINILTIVRRGGRGSKSYGRNYHRGKCLQLWTAPNCQNAIMFPGRFFFTFHDFGCTCVFSIPLFFQVWKVFFDFSRFQWFFKRSCLTSPEWMNSHYSWGSRSPNGKNCRVPARRGLRRTTLALQTLFQMARLSLKGTLGGFWDPRERKSSIFLKTLSV